MRDLRGDTLYFLYVDRFADGDPTNNGGRNPASFDPERRDFLRYWGGDLQGILDRLSYLERLGVTTLVLSPVVEQIPSLSRDRGMLSAAWAGAWAFDMRRIDPHLLPREEWDRPFSRRDTIFDRLLKACHDRGMRVLMQVYCGQSNPGGTSQLRGELLDDGKWMTSLEQDTAGWYRKGPGRDGREAADGPALFDPGSWGYRAWMLEVLAGWMDRGVDGFLFEAANQMPLWFWQELTSSLTARNASVTLLGKWGARAWDEPAISFADRAGLRSGDFGFHRHVMESLCWDNVGGLRRIANYLEHDLALADSTSLVTSLESGWVTRLQSAGLRRDHMLLALTLLLTSRGVPMLMYGAEQGLHVRGEEQEPYHAPMMEAFDDTAECRAIWRLAALRRENLAVQLGHYRTLWSSEDVLIYTRSHHEDRIVVALNRGREVTLDVSEVPFPDGPVFDVIGGGVAMVRNRKIEHLRLRPGEAVVFARTGQRESAGVRVTCTLSGYRSRFGETLVLTGDAHELGEWDIARAVPLQYSNPNLWAGVATFGPSTGRRVLYKYAVIDQRGAVLREDRLPRNRTVPAQGGLEWADRWGES